MKRTFLLIFLLAVTSWAQDPAPIPEPVPVDPVIKLNDEAVALAGTGDNDGAVVLLRKAIDLRKLAGREVDPVLRANLVRVLIGSASNLAEKQQWDEADARLLEARRVDGSEALIYAWEGVIAYRRGLYSSAMDRLDEALRRDAKLALAHEFQGMIHYKRENLEVALRSFETAVEIEPDRKDRLDPFIAKVKGELEREGTMRVLRSTHFVCKFGDEQERHVAEEVLDYLEDAYAKVGSSLREYPEESLTVVLYADRDFHVATGAQGWAAGIFDGKIRMPIRNFRGVRREVRSTLFHEYTHFVVSRLSRQTPSWLNEGLAQIMEEKTGRDVIGIVRPLVQKDEVPKLEDLVSSFARESDALKVRIYYAVGLSFVDWLRGRVGVERLGDLLRKLGSGLTLDAACRSALGEGLDDLEAAWKGSF